MLGLRDGKRVNLAPHVYSVHEKRDDDEHLQPPSRYLLFLHSRIAMVHNMAAAGEEEDDEEDGDTFACRDISVDIID